MLQTIQIVVAGKVQGVFYRQSTKEKAQQLNVNGYVRNLPDGNVEITATGTKEQLDKLIEWCRQGPPKAKVTSINFLPLPLKEFDRFSIIKF